METETPLLILGAGPFGLALAAEARHEQIPALLVGEPMGFWKRHMPSGMKLRSGSDWHLDPAGVHTMEKFAKNLAEPVDLADYLAYTRWFQSELQLVAQPWHIDRIDRLGGDLVAQTSEGQTVRARAIAVAPGFRHFAHCPPDLVARLPAGCWDHTCDLVEFGSLAGKRVLILGGRQSAFEWAALMLEAGAAEVHISHRHPSPRFQSADWTWVGPLVDRMLDEPGWFRKLGLEEQEQMRQRLWAEGRLKVEPWLEERVERARIWPETELLACQAGPSGLRINLRGGPELEVDRVVLATGYQVDVQRLPWLSRGNLNVETRRGYPVLDENFQTSESGLYLTSLAAVQDFGPFLGFTVSARAAARLIVRSRLAARA